MFFKYFIFVLECDVNYFGINCREMCNVMCKDCNRIIGICDIGCKFGWRDIYCYKGIFFNIYVKFKLIWNCLNWCILFILIMISKLFKLVYIFFSKVMYVFIICYILCYKI